MGRFSVQEEEAKLKPGTDKHIAFQCLKDAGAAGLNITQIMDAAKQNGVKDLDENSKRVIQYVSQGPSPYGQREQSRTSLLCRLGQPI